MEKQKTKQSSSIERKIECYPPPKYHALIKGVASVRQMRVGQVMNEIIKPYFDNMSEVQKNVFLNEGIKTVKQKNNY